MATVMTPQHANLWQRQPDEYFHISHMNMSGILSSQETSRATANPAVSRTFQTTTPMSMSVPSFGGHSHTTSVPYQPGTFTLDSTLVNPYSLQHFPVGFSNTFNYPTTTNVPPSPPVQDDRSRLPLDDAQSTGPAIKVEAHSPIQPSSMFEETIVNRDSHQTSHSPIQFATHVDTLMKAIQAKQRPDPQQRQLPAKVRSLDNQELGNSIDSLSPQDEEGETKSRRRLKKRHQCTIPGCDKRFYQKTHLQIHIRSHTGDKPFVSHMPAAPCFS